MASHMATGSNAARPNRKHGLMLMAGGFVLLVVGIVLTAISLRPNPEYDGRPRQSVRAELSYTKSERNKHYDSGYCWTGVYEWHYQGSSGWYESGKGYESEAEVPSHRRVYIYLGKDDQWHTSDDTSAAELFVGGIALVAVGLAAMVIGFIAQKAGISF